MPGPSAVVDAVRRRAERGFGTEVGILRVDLTESGRREVARLLGAPWDVSGRPVRLENLAAALSDHGLTVRAFVETIDGAPMVNRREVRVEAAAEAAAERAEAVELLLGAGVETAAVE
ncbi:MAG: TIGR02679 domain-containing protein, partial [Frankia sp.]